MTDETNTEKTMKWSKLLSKKRFCGLSEKKHTIADNADNTDERSAFEVDVDRIIFSGAFRRLNRKTQVHPLTANQFIHNRLTHSLEVARIGFSLGKRLYKRLLKKEEFKNNEITQNDFATIVHAACLAHDIGNPPFGHAGESAMHGSLKELSNKYFHHLDDEYQSDLVNYEGNAQGFRIISRIEGNYYKPAENEDCGGLKLTYATLGTFLKYPWTHKNEDQDKQGKFSVFRSEEKILNAVAKELGLIGKGTNKWCRHPLAYLVEAADDICYSIIDLEDAVELGILTFDEVYKALFGNKKGKKLSKSIKKTDIKTKGDIRRQLALLRNKDIFDKILDDVIDKFMSDYDKIMRGEFESDLLHGTVVANAKELAKKTIYVERNKMEIEIGCYSTLSCLLENFCDAAIQYSEKADDDKNKDMDFKSDHIIGLLDDSWPKLSNIENKSGWTKYDCLRRVIDFIGGMTDDHAVYISKQLKGLIDNGIR